MVKPTSAFTSPWYPSFCVGSIGLCFVRHCWSDSGCVGLTMCVFDDPKSSKQFSRIKLHEPDAGISQWSQPQKLELCGAASEADYRLVLSSSRFLNSEGKICWVTSSAFIHAQWQASFLALFRNLRLWKGGAAFRDLRHNVQFQGPQPIGPCWSEHFCELCITTEVLPPSSLLNISALLVPDQFSSFSQTLKL